MILRKFLIGALLALWPAVTMAQVAPTTPRGGAVTTITTGGTAVTPLTGPANGCYIINPLTATDQGIATAEPLYIDPTTTATTTATQTNVALQPGQSYSCVPLSTLPVSANAATSGHKFSVVRW